MMGVANIESEKALPPFLRDVHMIPAYSSKDRFDALRKALQTLTLKKVSMIELTDEKAVFLATGLSEEDVKTLVSLFAGWIGRTPIARLQEDKLILNY